MSWSFINMSANDAKSSIEREIRAKAVPDFARISWEGNTLIVCVDKGGKSEFKLDLKPQNEHTQCLEIKRSVALFHRPFVGQVEAIIHQIMTQAGGVKS